MSEYRTEHEIKCHPEYFHRIVSRQKTFEIRKNDRDYQVGDRLVIREYDPENGWPDHGAVATLIADIVYMTTAYQQQGYCVLGIEVKNDKE